MVKVGISVVFVFICGYVGLFLFMNIFVLEKGVIGVILKEIGCWCYGMLGNVKFVFFNEVFS